MSQDDGAPKAKTVVAPELILRLLALAIVAAALFVEPPLKVWLAAGGCALAAAVFAAQAARGRPVGRARWRNAMFAVVFAGLAVWVAFYA
jgi:hypothetical protein